MQLSVSRKRTLVISSPQENGKSLRAGVGTEMPSNYSFVKEHARTYFRLCLTAEYIRVQATISAAIVFQTFNFDDWIFIKNQNGK